LKRKSPKRILLYDKEVFPDTYEMVADYLHQRCLVQAIKNLMKRTGFIVDAVHEEEESDYPFLSPTAHSGRPPPFLLHDISDYMQAKKPSVILLFNNDIFDTAHGLNVGEVEVTDFDDFSDNIPNSTTSMPSKEDSNSDGPIGTPNVSNISPEEDEPEK
jgi:hypothetical protein